MTPFHNIPNEIVGAFLRDSLFDAHERLRAAKAGSRVTLPFPQTYWAPIPPAHVVDAVQRRGK